MVLKTSEQFCIRGVIAVRMDCSLKLQVDVLYLHNVEESQRGTLGDQAFMDRLKAAFQWLEKARAAGRIQVFSLLATDNAQQIATQLPLAYCTATPAILKLQTWDAGHNNALSFELSCRRMGWLPGTVSESRHSKGDCSCRG